MSASLVVSLADFLFGSLVSVLVAWLVGVNNLYQTSDGNTVALLVGRMEVKILDKKIMNGELLVKTARISVHPASNPRVSWIKVVLSRIKRSWCK